MVNKIIVTPGDPEYNTLRMNWDTRFNVYPRKIICVLNEKGVQETLEYIQKRGYKFAVRGGKHCFEPWSLTNGILIDMSKINYIRFDGPHDTVSGTTGGPSVAIPDCKSCNTMISGVPQSSPVVEMEKGGTITDESIVYIGAGAVLGDIYNTLLEHKRAIPAGTRPTVGIGGQGLNGGIGYSTRKYGLLIDSIVGYRVVLADGKIVTASANSNPDLFWALRGAGAGNFGIIIEYQVKTFRAHQVSVFTYTYNINDTMDDAVAALQWLMKPRDTITCQGLISKGNVKITGQYFGEPDTMLNLISDLPKPMMSDIRYIPFKDAVKYWSAPTKKESAKAKSRFGSQCLPEDCIRKLIKSVQKLSLDSNVRYTVGIQQLSGNSDGCIPWDKSQYWINWSLRWTSGPEPDAECLEKSYLKTIKYMDLWCYMGMMDANPGPPDYRKAYYGDNYKELVKIKNTYDPKGIFRYPQGL